MTPPPQPTRAALLALLDAVERHDFECIAGPLRLCVPWQDLRAALAVSGSEPHAGPEPVKVTRVEVIDKTGRVLVAQPCEAEIHFQDGGRTCKAFLDRPPVFVAQPEAGPEDAGTVPPLNAIRNEAAAILAHEPVAFAECTAAEDVMARARRILELLA